MESVESELLRNLENLFGFQFGKGKKFQDLDSHDFLDVYKIFFRIYDSAWLLSDGKPKTSVLKQIQSFLQRMELGHLILKGEDLLDSKKNCRLLGAIVSKLESRHNGTNNIQAAARKIRLLKPKAATEKNHLRKTNSSGSSIEEESVNPELIIPHKGKELPRTPPVKPGSDTDVHRSDFLVPKLAPPSIAAQPKTHTNSAKIVSTQKGFRPILPTKEIPRTPMKGVGVTSPVDGIPAGHNLTVDFSAARLTSSNTSTPYLSRSSRNQNSSSDGDATFLMPTKRRAIENPDRRPVAELSESGDEDVFEDANAGANTYVKETNPQEETKTPFEAFDNTWVLEMESPNTNSENLLPPEVLPEPENTGDYSKKKPGKVPMNAKAKGKPNSATAKTKDDEVMTVKTTAETMPENGETNHVATDTLTVVANGRKGKKISKKKLTEDNHVGETVADAIAEAESPIVETETLEPVRSAEPKGKKGRGKKAVGKKEAIEANHVENVVADDADLPVAPELPVAETDAKKGRAKRPSKKETNQDIHAEEVLEKKADHNVEVEAEEPVPVPEAKGKRGRGKKAADKKDVVEDDHFDSVAVGVNTSPQEAEAKKGRGKRPSKKETSEENNVEEVAEKEPEPECAAPVVEVKEKKGRGKKAQPISKVEEDISLPEDKSEPKLSSPAVEPNGEQTIKPGSKSKLGSKSKIGPKSKEDSNPAAEEIESPVNPGPEIQKRKGRGKKVNQTADSTSQPAGKIDPLQPQGETVSMAETNDISPAPEVRRGRAKGKATADEINEPERKPLDSPVRLEPDLKEKRGRGRAAAKDGADKAVKTDEEALSSVQLEPPAAPSMDAKEKRGRGRQAKTETTPAVEEVKDTSQSPEAVPAKKGRGKKALPFAKESDETEQQVEVVEDTKAKGKKGTTKRPIEEEVQPLVPDVPEKTQKTNRRGKVAAVPAEAEPSPPEVLKEDAAEVEGPRKSSRKKADPVKSYDESSEKSRPVSPKKRGGKKKPIVDEAAIADSEEVQDQKKKPAKKKGATTPEADRPKAVAPKRTSKRGQVDEASPPTVADNTANIWAKKGTKSPESPLKVVNGLVTDVAANSPKRVKLSEDNEAAEEPEKKKGANRKKKEISQPVESENESPHVRTKKGQGKDKEEAASIEVEKTKAASRKKLVAAQEEEADMAAPSVQSRPRGKRAAALTSDTDVFVAFIAGQQSTDPSPAGPPQAKTRRLKLVEQPAEKAAGSDDETALPPAVKRTYARRNK